MIRRLAGALSLPAIALSVLLGMPAAGAAAEPVRVLAAFTLKPALDTIAENYRRAGGEVVTIYGPSPALAKQIENGVTADLFFSADAAWIAELAQHRLIRPETVVDIVSNHLVLIARKHATKPVTIAAGPPLLQLVGAGPVAMCDPDSHPVGRYAKASLVTLGAWRGLQAKIVRVENPLLAVRMVARGDVPFAIVFATDAATDPGVDIVGTLPDDTHPEIEYPVAIVAASRNPEADRFFGYLKSAAAAAVFQRFGYVTPAAPR